MGRDILFQVTKGNLIVLFLQRVNSIRGHKSLPLVQRTYFRRRSYLDLRQFYVYKVSGSDNCFVLACKCNVIFLFVYLIVSKGNLTPLFSTTG